MEKLKAYLICSVSLMAVFVFGGLLYTAFDETPAVPAAAEHTAEQLPTVVLDAGHGGEDSGAVANGLLEKDLNLSIALKLRDMLRTAGIPVVMTREEDISIGDHTAATVRERKNSDLKNRVSIINEDDQRLLVSIHQNKFPQEQYSGTQFFYASQVAGSERLAEDMRKSVTGMLQPGNRRELKPAGNSIYILRQAKVPAVIAECGFISNAGEAARLSEEEYRQQMAFALFCGILDYLSDRQGLS